MEHEKQQDLHNKQEKETVWLTQTQMSELFQKDRTVITKSRKTHYIIFLDKRT